MLQFGSVQFSPVQSLTRVRLLCDPIDCSMQASVSITNSQSLLKLISIELVMPSNHLILCLSFFLLQSFSAWGSFQMSQFFASGGQSIGVSYSASVLSINIQDWFPLGFSGFISLQFKGLSRVFSNTTVQKHQFFMVSKVFPHWWQRWLGIWFYGLTIGDLCQLDDGDLVSEESSPAP